MLGFPFLPISVPSIMNFSGSITMVNLCITIAATLKITLFPPLVGITTPWNEEEFTLARYKEELGKTYSRITFYLCSSVNYLEHVTNSLERELDEDSDSSAGSLEDFKIKKKSDNQVCRLLSDML